MITKGQKINDRYQIIRSIGEGGMANVYLAYDTILDRNVAVKVLRGDLAEDEKFVRRFQREAISASSLTHPNIVEMYDVGEDEGKYFIVMEYLEGTTLKSLIKRRKNLTLAEVIDIMLQLTSGVACAHDSYIIHRDIKPQNVLILENGLVKITDFGIAMALNSNELTQTNSVMGSVHYLPPEQANGTGSTVKSDIYSLGILMFEALTGKLPFKGENAVEIAIKQMKEPIPSVCEINPEIPQSIENIILKATAKNPKNRYDNVKEMYDDIKSALDKDRRDEKKIAFMYPENDVEEKEIPSRSKNQEEKRKVEKEKKNDKKFNKFVLIFSIAFVVIAILSIILFMILSNNKPKDIEIPDVSDMTVVAAEKELEKLGFIVNNDVVEKSNEKILEGNVIETEPSTGRTVKEGTKITLVVSTGTSKFKIEDYKDKNIEAVKFSLEQQGIHVIIEDKEITKDDNIEDGTIVEQDIKAGEKLGKGDSITLTVAKIITVYPDFVMEGYTLEQAQTFCEDNGIVLQVTEKETNDYKENSIISQSRTSGTKVVKGVTLRITVAKKLPVVENPKEDKVGTTDDKKTESTDNKTETNSNKTETNNDKTDTSDDKKNTETIE